MLVLIQATITFENHLNMPRQLTQFLTALALFSLSLMIPPTIAAQDETNSESTHEFYEVRTYLLGDDGDEAAIDEYLANALIPALNRNSIQPIGAFAPTAADETGRKAVFVVIPYSNLAQVDQVRDLLANDEAYQKAGNDYLSRDFKNPPYARISSELLVSMDCWPKAKVPAGNLDNPDRVYELRLYESANERIGNKKVDMFNNGEVPIFLDCDITPIFIGQCILGPQMPSLTYLTVYESEAARGEAWNAFRAHPDWQVLKKVPKYAGTVSRIDKFVLGPKPYSQM